MVAPFVKTENIVMISPVNTDHQKTEDVAEIWRIQIEQRRTETVCVTSHIHAVQLRYFDFQNKQRNGNSEVVCKKFFDMR